MTLERAEEIIAKPFVERPRLVLERIEIGADAVAIAREPFGGVHQAGPGPLSAEALVHPKLGDVEPLPFHMPGESADDSSIGVAKKDVDGLLVRFAYVLDIEGPQAGLHRLYIGRIGVWLDRHRRGGRCIRVHAPKAFPFARPRQGADSFAPPTATARSPHAYEP